MIKRSDKGDSRKARVSLACERGGTYRHAKNKSNVEALNRKGTGTKKCDCPFKIIGVKLTSNDDWSVKVVCGFHNHQAAKQLKLTTTLVALLLANRVQPTRWSKKARVASSISSSDETSVIVEKLSLSHSSRTEGERHCSVSRDAPTSVVPNNSTNKAFASSTRSGL